MSSAFSDNFKERTQQISGECFTCTMLEFKDKLLVSVARNGEVNITYDIQTPSFSDLKKPQRRYIFDEEAYEDSSSELNNTIVPSLLIGAPNLKMQVTASQIGLVISTLCSKNVILNISGKLYGSQLSEEYKPTDFTTLHEVLALVKETYIDKQ